MIGSHGDFAAFDLPGAVASAQAGVWSWDRGRDLLSLSGDLASSGLQSLSAESDLASLLACASPDDRDMVRAAFDGESAIAFRLQAQDGRVSFWRGGWIGGGARAEGLLFPIPSGVPTHDALTGLLARATFLERAARAPGGAVVVADLTRFRRLNEALGPARADEVLSVLAARLSASYPAAALAARVGEDEFALMDLDAPSSEERLASLLEAPLTVGGFDIHPRVSTGRAACAAGGPPEWLRRAALAMESAGGAGGAGGQRGARSRLALEAEAHSAIEHGGLEPFYQPIVDLATGRVGGFEALVRWRHPRLGLLHPDEFLDALETTGLIGRLGLFMIETAADQLAAWRKAHPTAAGLSVNVNITSDEIMRPGMVEEIADVIARTGLAPGALKLELTEHEVMRDPDAAARVMERLKAAGVALAVDDFGMGYSSLSYLARLPLQTLKIDQYFVRAMGANEAAAKIVRSVVALGRDLGLEIVAEGVENAVMAETLRAMGCQCGQGYAYARALPAADAETYFVWSHLPDRPARPPRS